MLWVQGLPAGNQVRLEPARGPGDSPRGPSLQQGAWAGLTLRTELGSELEDLGAGVETGEQMIPLQASPHSVTEWVGGAGGSTACGSQQGLKAWEQGGEMTLPVVPVDGLGKWEAMPGGGGRLGEVRWAWGYHSCDWALPLVSPPPNIQAFSPRRRWRPHSPLSTALCPTAHCDLAGGKRQGLAGREGGGLFPNLGKLIPNDPPSLDGHIIPFPPSVPSEHPGD